jgi:hypothetical protein
MKVFADLSRANSIALSRDKWMSPVKFMAPDGHAEDSDPERDHKAGDCDEVFSV